MQAGVGNSNGGSSFGSVKGTMQVQCQDEHPGDREKRDWKSEKSAKRKVPVMEISGITRLFEYCHNTYDRDAPYPDKIETEPADSA